MTREHPSVRRVASRIRVQLVLLLGIAATATGCADFPSKESASAQHGTSSSSKAADLDTYFDTIDRLAPGDTQRQATALSDALAAVLQAPTSSNKLRYAIALGVAGREGSNPVEGRRQIGELLAGPNDLKPQEIALANAFLREFDARVALYAEVARQREESQQRIRALEQDADQNSDALSAENARLKKALADAERKLEAVAEMERSLLEQSQKKP